MAFPFYRQIHPMHLSSSPRPLYPDNKVSLGFMEGLNNKIRAIQRRAYGIKDQRYLMLKVLTSFIPVPW